MQEKHLRLLEKLDDLFRKEESKDNRFDNLLKSVNKCFEYMEEVSKDIADLKKDSHPSQEYICCRKCGCKISKTKTKK